MAVSFAQDIRRLFTGMNIAQMKGLRVALDDSDYMRSSPRAEGPGRSQHRAMTAAAPTRRQLRRSRHVGSP
jgi:hypothetical protein